MSRKMLENQIRTLDEQLAIELALLKLDGRERRAAVTRIPPLIWVAVASVGGLVAGKIIGSRGPRLLLSQGGNLFRLGSMLMPGLAMASSKSE